MSTERGSRALRVRLRDVPEEFREDLHSFIEDGTLPLKNAVLMQILIGLDVLAARSLHNRHQHLSAILAALAYECPDHAWSSIGACIRWERRGGLSGCRRQLQ
ncbi:hypothetical protein [Sinorhizobium meliloti]|uniref:hypothetical protein n=1 Tax=Rhizobium meliloti TaxID=382 RepID=UPI00030B0280|nr:hypothetical protein [Sinorhizobium meliloti]MBP2466402.1 hypothetical protein [Sinorhizobium meliloti]MCO6422701.1 hypothetical protein [Sinorhizobium meliloti]MDE4558920.1 hypothetical protein [Sinorhizobium meliloti SM11]MDE4593081.1 hypothetical protein [Sinorhizobium meliloti]